MNSINFHIETVGSERMVLENKGEIDTNTNMSNLQIEVKGSVG